MTRKLISLAGMLVAVCSFTVGSTDAEARHCRTPRTRCCRQQAFQQQSCNTGCRQTANVGCNSGCNGNIGNNGNSGYQQTSNYAPGQVTYGTPGVAVDGGQPAPEVQATAPAPNN